MKLEGKIAVVAGASGGIGREVSRALSKAGAEVVGAWPTDEYEFESSKSVINGQFAGLVIDQSNQPLLTEERIITWLDIIKPALLENIPSAQAQTV